MAEYPKVYGRAHINREDESVRFEWVETRGADASHQVVPLGGVHQYRDDNGQWPDGAPLRAAADAYRTRMKAGGLPIAALEVVAVQAALAAYLDALEQEGTS